MKIKSALIFQFRRVMSIFGLRVSRISTSEVRGVDPMLDLQCLLKNRNRPVIFDVGANEGETVQAFLDSFENARVVAFEPFESCWQTLKSQFANRPNVQVEKLALGDKRGSSELKLFSGSNMNSLLDMDHRQENQLKDAFVRTGSMRVEVDTLDDYCSRNGIKDVDVIKIDTQGYDLNVLKGGSRLLQEHRLRVILLEVNFIPMYQGQATFQELHAYLSSFGYRLVDLYNQVRQEGYTAWCDACYVAADGATEFGPLNEQRKPAA